MGILICLVPITLLLSGFGVCAWIWACKKGQFEDLDSPPTKILFEDEFKGRS